MIVDVDTHWEATSYASDEHPLGAVARPAARQPRHARVRHRRRSAARAARGRPARRPRSCCPAWCAWPRSAAGRSSCTRCTTRRRPSVSLDGPHRHRPLPREPRRVLAAARVPRRRPAAGVRRCNDFLTEQLADRSRPSARRWRSIDFTDLDVAVAELERARGARAPARSSSTPSKGDPPGGVSPGHPAWDPRLDRGDPPRHARRDPRRQHRSRTSRLGRHRVEPARRRGHRRARAAREHAAHPRGAEPVVGAPVRRRVRPSPESHRACSRRCG